MERLMNEAPRATIERVNARLAILLEGARRALRGEGDFDVQDVRRFREAIGEMASLVAQWAELRRLQPEMAGELDLYKSQLSELQTSLVRIRVMLHARRAHLEVSQLHNAAVSRWVSAFRQTR
jgi:hypothetical protein